jgi:putative restriction endonuclease
MPGPLDQLRCRTSGMAVAGDLDERLGAAAFAWLDDRAARGEQLVRYDELAQFEVDGQRIPLMDRQRGIRKPAVLEAALSFRTTFTPPGQVPPYEDAAGDDGLQRYKFRGDDPQHAENVALRRAMQRALPLIWFVGVSPAVYQAVYPVWLVAEEASDLQFVVALDAAQRFVLVGARLEEDQRRYI